jgi:hypothetical protein
MTGRAPHNADSTQRTKTTEGTDPPQFPNEAQKGQMNKIEGQGQLKRQPENYW